MKLALVHHVGLPLEGRSCVDEVLPGLRLVGSDELVVESPLHSVEELLDFVIEHLVTVDAEVLLSGSHLLAARAGHGSDLFGRLLLDLEAVHRRVLLLLGLPGELRDVAGDDGRASGTTLSVLDERLGLLSLREPVGVRLPEVRRRDRFGDVGPLRGFAEALQELGVADPLGCVQLRPHVVLGPAGMLGQPALHVRDCDDEVDVVFAALSVDADLERVVSVGDVADLHVEELAAAEPTLELEHDERAVAGVSGHLDHRLDVFLAIEHVGLVGLGLVVPRGLRRYPVVRVGDLVVAGEVLPEESERDAVVAVGLLGAVLDVVGVVDPADDDLGGLLRLVERLVVLRVAVEFLHERVVEAGLGVLAHPAEMPEELLVSVVPVVFAEQSELVAELQEEFAVPVASPAFALVESVSKRFDRLLRLPCHGPRDAPRAGKPLVDSPPPAYNKKLTIPCGKGQLTPFSTPSRGDTPYNATCSSPRYNSQTGGVPA